MEKFYLSLRIFPLAIRIPNRIYILFLLLILAFNSKAQTVFWTETFDGAVCAAGSGCDPSLVAWTTTNVGGNGAAANKFYVSCQENGNAAATCGTGCGTNQTLHVGNVASSSAAAFFCPTGDCGAAYDATGANEVTSKRCESPVINCTGKSTITISFVYMERGQTTLDNATFWYYDGSAWAQVVNMAKTPTASCGAQGEWTNTTVSLPVSANNNANVRIAFMWVNNGDGTGSDPSFAVNDVRALYLTLLPIELISFSAIRIDKEKVKLNWITESETNNDFFTVEKSNDGEKFIPILNKDGSGNSNQILNYVDYDFKANDEFVFYRLKQTDFNGEFSYSNTIKMSNEGFSADDLVLYPNPAKDEVSILLSDNYENMNLVLMDIQGRLVREMNITETNNIRFDLAGILDGVYFMHVNADGILTSKKIIIAR